WLQFDGQMNRLRDELGRSIRVLLDELHEEATDSRSGQRRDTANHGADEQRDRKLEAEAVRRYEFKNDGVQRASETNIECADAERDRLSPRRINSHRIGC